MNSPIWPAARVYGNAPEVDCMLSGHRPPPRRRGKGRAKRIAVPFAIPMALGLTLGVMLAVSGGNNTHIDQSSLQATPMPSVSAPACPTATRAAGTPASPAPARSSAAASSTVTAQPCPSPS
jgi:hypothetical protein